MTLGHKLRFTLQVDGDRQLRTLLLLQRPHQERQGWDREERVFSWNKDRLLRRPQNTGPGAERNTFGRFAERPN